jgi:hypothetical protein
MDSILVALILAQRMKTQSPFRQTLSYGTGEALRPPAEDGVFAPVSGHVGRLGGNGVECYILHESGKAGIISDTDRTSTKMEPMFLPGVENDPQPGPYADALRMMQATGNEYSQIWHMFAFKPRATDHLARFTQEIMREPAPLSPWIRELIAAFTSARNDCPF